MDLTSLVESGVVDPVLRHFERERLGIAFVFSLPAFDPVELVLVAFVGSVGLKGWGTSAGGTVG